MLLNLLDRITLSFFFQFSIEHLLFAIVRERLLNLTVIYLAVPIFFFSSSSFYIITLQRKAMKHCLGSAKNEVNTFKLVCICTNLPYAKTSLQNGTVDNIQRISHSLESLNSIF